MVNKAIIIGNTCGECELRYTASGTAVGSLSVATNRRWKDKAGQQQEETEFHRITVWDQTAKYCSEYIKKGNKVYVEGRLQTRKYDKDGQTHYTTEIIANEVKNLSPRSDEGRQSYPEPPGGNIGTGQDVPFAPCY